MLSGVLPTISVVAGLFLCPSGALGEQPYHDWDAAYKAAETLVSSWTTEQVANISIRNGVAPGYTPFTALDGTFMAFKSALRRGLEIS